MICGTASLRSPRIFIMILYLSPGHVESGFLFWLFFLRLLPEYVNWMILVIPVVVNKVVMGA